MNLSSLTVLEAAELSKLLEEKWGVSAAAPMAVAAAGPAAAAAAPVEEKTEFDVDPRQDWRQEDRGDQGSPGDHRSWPQGGEGSGGGCSQAGQGGHRTRRMPRRSRRSSKRWAPQSSSSKRDLRSEAIRGFPCRLGATLTTNFIQAVFSGSRRGPWQAVSMV